MEEQSSHTYIQSFVDGIVREPYDHSQLSAVVRDLTHQKALEVAAQLRGYEEERVALTFETLEACILQEPL